MEELLLMAVGFLGFLGGFGSGGAGSDFVSFLPTDTYFQSRRIPMNIENLMDLATTEPKNGRSQILQLMALRALGEKPELSKKDSAAILRTLEKVARGELAKDRLGFSQEYARRTLGALGGKTATPRSAPRTDLRDDALGWFPASATLVGFLGGVPQMDPTEDYGSKARPILIKLTRRPRDWDEIFKAVEMVGNVRIDRFSFAYAADGKQKEKDRFYVRITGKADHQRLVAGLKQVETDLTWKESKDTSGTPITTAQAKRDGAAAFIGDTDLLVGSFADGQTQNDPLEVLQQFLAVRTGKEKSVLKGALQGRLPKLSQETVGVLVGDLSEDLRREFFKSNSFPAPRSICAELLRTKDGISLPFQTVLGNAEEAKQFVEAIREFQKTLLDQLKKTQKQTKDATMQTRRVFDSVQKAIESLQLQVDGAAVKGTISVPIDAVLAVFLLRAHREPAVHEVLPLQVVEPSKEEARLWLGAPPGWTRITIPEHSFTGG
jgi:hypothetical protein